MINNDLYSVKRNKNKYAVEAGYVMRANANESTPRLTRIFHLILHNVSLLYWLERHSALFGT